MHEKQQIRKNVCLIRENQEWEASQKKSRAICNRILSIDLFLANNIKGKKIALYFTHKGEVDLTRLKEYFIQNGADCFYPITYPDKIQMEKYNSALDEKEQCRTGAMGILEPARGRYETGNMETIRQMETFEAMDWVFIPGIAFDMSGNRIGYGKGYYDRYLAAYPSGHRPVLVAPAFEFQLFEHFPHESHDIPVDLIVTEERVIDVKQTILK